MHSNSRSRLLASLAALSAVFLPACGGGGGQGGSGAPVGVVVTGPAATATLSLFAGGLGGPTSADGSGSDARFNRPGGVVVDSKGNLFVADTYNDTIRKVTPTGMVSTFAGMTNTAGAADGVGTAATFNTPRGLAIDSQDSIYVADYGNDTIRKITSNGTVSTLAGYPGAASFADTNTKTPVFFNSPSGVAVDAALNVYVADTANNAIRKISASGVVTTIAGGPTTAGSANGPVASATFRAPMDIALDSQGNIYVADLGNYCIREIAAGTVSTVAGTANSPGSTDGPGSSALFNSPAAIVVDGSGNIDVADSNTIRQISTLGVVSTLAGKASVAGSANGNGPAASFNAPGAIAVDKSNTLYIADSGNSLIRELSSANVASTLAGSVSPNGTTSQTGYTNGVTSAARFYNPTGLSVDSTGNVYVADTFNSTVRKITAAGFVSTHAGMPGNPGAANGAATAAGFALPYGTVVDGAGNVYVADTYNNTIRSISSSGLVGTLAGSPGVSGTADGNGAQASFKTPIGIALDSTGNLYVSDTGNFTIRKITPAGLVTTLAGVAGTSGASDGPAASALFKGPAGLAVDSKGNVYVADASNNSIRKITPGGTVSTLAGSFKTQGSADGVGAAASFNDPIGLAVDSADNLYVADSNNFTIRKITPDGTVTTVAGLAGVQGVVLGSGGTLGKLFGIAIDGAGNLYVTAENAVIKVTFSNLPDIALTAAPMSIALGKSTSLNWWSSSNTVSCAASSDWNGNQATVGAVSETPSAVGTATYTLTCANAAGTTSRSVAVTVVPPPAVPTLTLSASPTSITLGQSTTLTWSTTNATACGASGSWGGNEATSGSYVATPAATGVMTYTLNCSNTGVTSAPQSTSVTVTAAPTSSSSSTTSSGGHGGAAGLDLVIGLGLLGVLRRRAGAPRH